MGDWEDVFGSAGMDPDFAPWDSPSWNDEWEYDLIDQGFKTVQEWNALNRIIKKGEKGKHLPSLQKMVFSEQQTINSQRPFYSEEYFATYEEAIAWAKSNPGKPITRSPDGKGFTKKTIIEKYKEMSFASKL